MNNEKFFDYIAEETDLESLAMNGNLMRKRLDLAMDRTKRKRRQLALAELQERQMGERLGAITSRRDELHEASLMPARDSLERFKQPVDVDLDDEANLDMDDSVQTLQVDQ